MRESPFLSMAIQTASLAVLPLHYPRLQLPCSRINPANVINVAPPDTSRSIPKAQTTNYTHFTRLSFFFLSSSRNSVASASAASAFNEFDGEKEEEEGEQLRKDEVAEEGRLYVGNLPYAMTPSQIEQVFSEAGRVAAVEVIYDRVTDRSRGFAFVTMGSEQHAKEAIRMFDGSQIGGRTVKVNFPEVPRGGEREMMGPKTHRSNQPAFVDTPYKIYVGNLKWDLTSQDLRRAFAGQPGALSAKVIYEKISGRSRGFGFISFSSAVEAELALNTMNGVELEGRPLRLSLAAKSTFAVEPKTQETEIETTVQGDATKSILEAY